MSAEKKKNIEKVEPSKSGSSLQFCRENALSIFFLTITFIGAIFLCYLLSLPLQTPRDNFLESAGLIILSSWGSYLVSKMLSELGYNKTLRDHGVQIASNIMVFKKQIENLADWVAHKRSIHGQNSTYDAELDHIQQTLQVFRDMNNANLGAVAGIIGDALAQYNTLMKQVSEIRGSATEQTTEIETKMQFASLQEIPALQTQIKQIKDESEKKVNILTSQTRLPIPSLPLKRKFSDGCPYCGEVNGFEMLDRPGETKLVSCNHCTGRFNVHVTNGQKVFTRPYSGKKSLPVRKEPMPSGGRIQTEKLKDSILEMRDWMSPDKESECIKLLKEINFRVPPEDLPVLLELAITHDSKLRTYNLVRSPNELQTVICLDNSKSIYNGIVRIFFRNLMRGQAFVFEGKTGWRFPYKNILEEGGLKTSFLRANIDHLKEIRPIKEEDASWLVKVFLPNPDASWVEIAKDIINN